MSHCRLVDDNTKNSSFWLTPTDSFKIGFNDSACRNLPKLTDTYIKMSTDIDWIVASFSNTNTFIYALKVK